MLKYVILCSALAIRLGAPLDLVAFQASEENRASISFFGGVSGGASLWTINRQRLGVINRDGVETSVDTVLVGRRLRQGIAAGMALTFFPTSALGWTFEFSYFGFKRDDSCTHLFDSTNGLSPNAQNMCASINQRAKGSGSVNIVAGGIFRPDLGLAWRPFVKLNVGVADRGSSTIEMSGNWLGQDRLLIADTTRGALRPTYGVALGVTVPTAPGYRMRWEVRDQFYRRDILAGAANALAIAPTRSVWKHNIAVLVGLEVILEKKRSRRY